MLPHSQRSIDGLMVFSSQVLFDFRKLTQFFTSGAPVLSTRVWDMTPRLTQL